MITSGLRLCDVFKCELFMEDEKLYATNIAKKDSLEKVLINPICFTGNKIKNIIGLLRKN